MGGVIESIAAVVFCLSGGFMNSSWPLCCKPESPSWIRVATNDGWQWENIWFPFAIWTIILNIILCVSVVGLSTLLAVYRDASTFDFTLVCVFGFLWGSGTMCFSLGIQMLGAGPGIALVMSLLVVIGTLLPLIEDHADNAASPAALVTILGLVFAIIGFVTSAQSSRIKTRSITASQRNQSGETAGEAEDKESTLDKTESSCFEIETLSSGRPTERSDKEIEEKGKKGASHLVAVAVCVAGAVMSSMLQFSFVYGGPLITDAEEEKGLGGAAAPLVIWLLAFSFSGLYNVGYACYLLWTNKTWGRYKWEGFIDMCLKFLKVTVMSIFFFGHIHLYGVAQHLFGDLGPVIAWPLLMSSTVLSGQLWSLLMKEWVGVPKMAMTVNILSICLLVLAVIIIAVAGAVL